MEQQARSLPTTLRSPPSLDDYTPLSEHQAQTPATFFGGKPVLHYHATSAKAYLPKSQRGMLAFFPADAHAPASAEVDEDTEELIDQVVDLFVNSE